MAAKIAGVLSKKVLKESEDNRFGQEDPYFEMTPATNLIGQPKMKKRRKAAPEGISAHDAKVLTKVKRRAYRLDLSLCNFCGIRFGWGSVIGLIPAFGDAIDTLFALMVVASCTKIEGGLPGSVTVHMLFNVVLDFAVGLIPILGDLADALYRCNTKNAVLLETYLKEKGRKRMKQRANQGMVIEPAGNGSPGGSGHGEPADIPTQDNGPRRPEEPEAVYLPASENQRPDNGGSKRQRQPDLEMGMS